MRKLKKPSVAFLCAALIAALGCSGLDLPDFFERGGISGPVPADMHVSKATVKKKTRARRPKRSDKEGGRVSGEFMIKLRDGAGAPRFLQSRKIQTRDNALNSTFANLDVDFAALAHRIQPKNQALANALVLERTVRFKSSRPPEQVIAKLHQHPSVEWVEPVIRLTSAEAPDDPYFQYQWHLQQLNVPEAWEISRGTGVVVAVLDTGVSEGPDGFYKLLKGKDFIDDDDTPDDENGHGTHVAGTIAQATNNETGVAGIAPEAHILPVRVLDKSGAGDTTAVAEGIIWATDNGADIINLSLGSLSSSTAVEDACAYAYEQGVTVIAATGNNGFTDFIGFPAAYSTTIAVGAVDAKKGIAYYSNQGQEIDVVAPGGDVTSDQSGDGMADGVVQETRLANSDRFKYEFMQGTSMAAPHVAGLAALLHSIGLTHPDSIRYAITQSSSDLEKVGWDPLSGYGLIDPVAALNEAKAAAEHTSKLKKNGSLEITETTKKTLSSGRIMIGWRTNVAAQTLCKGDDGFRQKEENQTTTHRVVVSGTPGKTVTYTLGASKGSQRAKTSIKVTF